MHSKKSLYYGLLVIVFAMWGGGFVAMKIATSSLSILHVVFIRVAFPCVFYLVIYKCWIKIPYQTGDWKYLIALVTFEPCLLFLFETSSLYYTTASQAGVIAACFPLCVSVGAWVFLKEKMNLKMIIGMFVAVIGVAGASFFAVSESSAPNALLGNILMGGAVFSTTGYALCARYIMHRYSFLSISAIQAVGGTLVFLPAVLLSPMPEAIELSGGIAAIYLGIGLGIFAYLGFNFGLQKLPAAEVALFSNLIPIFTLLFAFTLLHEKLTILQIFFVALTLCGVIIASLPNKELSTEQSGGHH